MYVGWVRGMCVGVLGEVGKRDTFSAVIICIMDFFFCLIIIKLNGFDVALMSFLHVVFKLMSL